MVKKDLMKKNVLGVTAEKDEFSEWFTQIMLKADLADYTDISGEIVFKPGSYELWERIQQEVDVRFKKLGIRNCYFPLFIPEKSLKKEQEYIDGFAPEVAWVTGAGNTKFKERLAVRPTSEPIMYESYSKWIRSWRDLPLKLNQWNNVVRWEFKHPVPFLRTREFLWNEGHTVFANKKEAEDEGEKIIQLYDEVCREYLALPSLIGRKSEREKFAGAEYTISLEYYMPNGRAIQGPDFHHDGQNFAKAYNIKFLNKNGKNEYVYQNTFAISTRMLGVMFAVHSDSKGLVLPPKIATTQIVIVPILFDESKKNVLEVAKKIKKSLGVRCKLDDRENYKPGFKFNEWELKGIPLRIEIGPNDLTKGEITITRRDIGKKESVKIKDLKKRTEELLIEIQNSLLKRAEKILKNSIVQVNNMNDFKDIIKNKKIALVPLCDKLECEEKLKENIGVKVLNIPNEQPKNLSKCLICSNDASYLGRVGKSY